MRNTHLGKVPIYDCELEGTHRVRTHAVLLLSVKFALTYVWHGTNCHHRFVAFLLLLLLNVNLRHLYSITLLANIVRRALVVSRHLRRPNLVFRIE